MTNTQKNTAEFITWLEEYKVLLADYQTYEMSVDTWQTIKDRLAALEAANFRLAAEVERLVAMLPGADLPVEPKDDGRGRYALRPRLDYAAVLNGPAVAPHEGEPGFKRFVPAPPPGPAPVVDRVSKDVFMALDLEGNRAFFLAGYSLPTRNRLSVMSSYVSKISGRRFRVLKAEQDGVLGFRVERVK